MQLEDYFDFLAPYDIRIKGHRIGIESVLLDYLDRHLTPETIQERYPRLTVEQVYATILYYWRERESVQRYLNEYQESSRLRREDFAKNPPPFVKRLRQEQLDRTSLAITKTV